MTKKTAITIVKDRKGFVTKIAVCFDAGGKRVVAEAAIINRTDDKVNPQIILLFEGTDNYGNMNATLYLVNQSKCHRVILIINILGTLNVHYTYSVCNAGKFLNLKQKHCAIIKY